MSRPGGLLAIHLAGMHANSPPGSVFALDLSGLQAPGGDGLGPCGRRATSWASGALRDLGEGVGELKIHAHASGPSAPAGFAALPARLHDRAGQEPGDCIGCAWRREAGAAFDPALALYRRRGFVRWARPFADYRKSDFNRFLQLSL